MVPEDQIEYTQLYDDKDKALDEWIHFDMLTQHAVKGPKPKTKKLIPTGSMKQVELDCSDCGADLRPSAAAEGLFVCARLHAQRLDAVEVRDERGQPALLVDDEAPKPKAHQVLECGRLGL
jgi:hypothetical protein